MTFLTQLLRQSAQDQVYLRAIKLSRRNIRKQARLKLWTHVTRRLEMEVKPNVHNPVTILVVRQVRLNTKSTPQ